MKKTSISILTLFALLLSMSCSKEEETDLFTLEENIFLFEVDRVSSGPSVQFPQDELEESDFQVVSQGSIYDISLDDNTQTILIMPGNITGELQENSDEFIKYNLSAGLSAGGRFTIWKKNGLLEAEYTIYGSGLPIIESERGNLSSK